MSREMGHAVLVFLLAVLSLPAQTDQEVYERFLSWLTQQPVEIQRGPDAEVDLRYRTRLKQQGLSDPEIDTQLRIIDQQGRRLEAER